MDTLTSAPVADVLARLSDEAQVADGPLKARLTGGSQDRGDAVAELLAGEPEDYKALYHGYATNFLNVSAEFGQFLYICARGRPNALWSSARRSASPPSISPRLCMMVVAVS